MIESTYYACEFLYTFVKCWLSFELVSAVSQHKTEKKMEYVTRVVASLGVTALYVYNTSISDVLFSNNMMWLAVLLLSAVSGIIYRCRFWNRFGFVYLLWLGLTMIDFFVQTLSFVVFSKLGKSPTQLLVLGNARSVYMILSALFVARFGIGIINSVREMRLYQYRKWLFGALVPLTIFMIYFQNIYILEVPELLMNSWWIAILGMILCGMYFGINILRRREEEERRLHQMKWNMLEENYQSLLQIYEEKAILLHDTKNHFQMIQEMVTEDQKEELLHYIKEITGKMQGYRNHDYVNHKEMNLILGMKIREAEDAGIRIEVGFDDMSMLQVQPMELCAMLSNLLDNAIEANLKISETDKRWLKIYCVRKHHMMVLTISNPICEGGVNRNEGEFITTKEDKKIHGFGMRSVKRIVEKYDGHMRVDVDEKVFLVTIYIHAF